MPFRGAHKLLLYTSCKLIYTGLLVFLSLQGLIIVLPYFNVNEVWILLLLTCVTMFASMWLDISAVILLLESTLIIGGQIIADYPIIGQNLWRHNICM